MTDEKLLLDLGRKVKEPTGTLADPREFAVTGNRAIKWNDLTQDNKLTFWGVYEKLRLLLQNQRKWVDETAKRYDSCVCNVLCKAFMEGGVAFEDLLEEDVQERWQCALNIMKEDSVKTACYTLLRLIMAMAFDKGFTTTTLWGMVSPEQFSDYTDTRYEDMALLTAEEQRRKQAEQVARMAIDNSICIMPETERKIYRTAEKLIPLHGEYMGLLLVMETGLRPSEMLALEYGDLIKMGDTYVLQVAKTSEKDSRTTKDGGKTRNMYRYVCLSHYLSQLILRRKALIEVAVKDAADKLPLVCVGTDYTKRCTQKEANRAFKYVLYKCDVAEDTMRAAAATVRDNKELREETASLYLLRHQMITWAVACGCSRAMIFAQAGHKVEDMDAPKSDFSNPDLIREMAELMSRRPLIQDLDGLSLNRELTPAELGGGVVSSGGITLHLRQGEQVVCHAYALEPGQPLQIAGGDDITVMHSLLPPRETPAGRPVNQLPLLHHCSEAIAAGAKSSDTVAAEIRDWLDRGRCLQLATKAEATWPAAWRSDAQNASQAREETIVEQSTSEMAFPATDEAKTKDVPTTQKESAAGTIINYNGPITIQSTRGGYPFAGAKSHGRRMRCKRGRANHTPARRITSRPAEDGKRTPAPMVSQAKDNNLDDVTVFERDVALNRANDIEQGRHPAEGTVPALLSIARKALPAPTPVKALPAPPKKDTHAKQMGPYTLRPVPDGKAYLITSMRLKPLDMTKLELGKVGNVGQKPCLLADDEQVNGICVHNATVDALLIAPDCTAYYIPSGVDLEEYVATHSALLAALCGGGRLLPFPDGMLLLFTATGYCRRITLEMLPHREGDSVALWPGAEAPKLAGIFSAKEGRSLLLLLNSGYALHVDVADTLHAEKERERRFKAITLRKGERVVEVLPYDADNPETIGVTAYGWAVRRASKINAHGWKSQGVRFFGKGAQDTCAYACKPADGLLLPRSDGSVLCVRTEDLSSAKGVSHGKATMRATKGEKVVGVLPLQISD